MKVETENTHYPTCPFCGHEHPNWYDGTSMNHDGDYEDTQCDACDKSYTQYVHIDYAFSTVKRQETLLHEMAQAQRAIERAEGDRKAFGDDYANGVKRAREGDLTRLEAEMAALKESGEWEE